MVAPVCSRMGYPPIVWRRDVYPMPAAHTAKLIRQGLSYSYFALMVATALTGEVSGLSRNVVTSRAR